MTYTINFYKRGTNKEITRQIKKYFANDEQCMLFAENTVDNKKEGYWVDYPPDPEFSEKTTPMHKIDQFIADIRKAKEVDTKAFMGIHLRIMDILRWRTVPNDFIEYPLRNFKLFRHAYDNTLRIGLSSNAPVLMLSSWRLGEVPTPDVQDAFFRELENEIKDDQV